MDSQKLIESNISKTTYKSVIAAAYRDMPFMIFLLIVTAKIVLFIFLSYKEHLTAFRFILSFPANFGIILALLAVSLCFKNNLMKISYLFLLDFILSLLFLTQSLYFKYYSDYASVYHLNLIPMLSSVTDAIIEITNKEIFFIADFPFIMVSLLWLKKRNNEAIPFRRFRVFIFFLLFGIIFSMPALSLKLLFGDYSGLCADRKCFVQLMGLVNYHIYDAFNYSRERTGKHFVTHKDIETVNVYFKEKRLETIKNEFTAIGEGFNLFVIQVESLQNFIIGTKWRGNEVTPNLNRLARTGIYFNQIFDQTWAGNTSDSAFLTNCSLYPSSKGAVSFLYAQHSFYCLPEVLREHGYTVATMHAFKGTFWNRRTFEKALGFELQFYKDSFVMEDHLGWGLSDKAFFSQSVEKIKSFPSPFHAFLTTLTSHVPYDDVTAEIDNFPLGDIEGKLIGHYVRSMHYVDSAIGLFLKKLSENNLASNSIIVVYGDHRARFVENDLKMIGITDMIELRKIPLIINIPEKKLGYRIDTVGGLIDVAPTISNILGINISDTFFMGKDLLDLTNSFVIFRNGSYISERNSIDETYAQEQLRISDLILEKDIVTLIKNRGLHY